jgi:hypothetical protein
MSGLEAELNRQRRRRQDVGAGGRTEPNRTEPTHNATFEIWDEVFRRQSSLCCCETYGKELPNARFIF